MKIFRTPPKQKNVNRMIGVHDDGTVSIAFSASRMTARPVRKRNHYHLIHYTEKLKMPLLVDGVEMHHHITVTAYCKPNQNYIRKQREVNLRHARP